MLMLLLLDFSLVEFYDYTLNCNLILNFMGLKFRKKGEVI